MPRDLRRAIAERAVVVAVVVTIPTILGFFGGLWWMLDLFAHFRVQYAALGALSLAAALLRPKRYTAIAAIPVLVNLACIAPLYLRGQPADTKSALVVTSFNVHTSNPDKAAVVSFLKGSGADVIFLYEVDRPWMQALEQLAPPYAVVVSRPDSDNFGIVALARVPIADHAVRVLSSAMVPSIEVTIVWEGREMVLLATHTLPPIDEDYSAKRDEQLRNIADWSAAERRPHALFGDLNATLWSSAFRELIDRGQLHDPTRGFRPTWPHGPVFAPLLRIPIDHVLVSDGVECVGRTDGEPLGSDHVPVTARLTLTSTSTLTPR